MEDLNVEVRALAPSANAVASFSCHETKECLAAITAAAVLANLTNGVFSDPQGGGCMRGEVAVSYARAETDAAAKKEAEETERHGKLSPAKWARAFEQTIHRVNPEYQLSRDFRGRLVECTRQDSTGVFLSQNCVRIHDSYKHCFAVLLTRAKLGGSLDSPLVLDRDSTTTRQSLMPTIVNSVPGRSGRMRPGVA